MKYLLLLILLPSIIACQIEEEVKENEATTKELPSIPSEIKMTHRVLSGCQNDSCYFDMYNMTHKYGYGLSLEFGNDWGENEFKAVQVVDQIGIIVDLGEKSCKDMINTYEQDGEYYGPGQGGYPHKEDRKYDPMFWLSYSEAWNKLQNGEGSPNVKVEKNHCYLMHKSSSHQEVIVAFHVKEHEKDQFIILDEIEVFKRSTIAPTR